MSDPFLSEIRMASFNFAPKGWALSNGQLLPINQNQALFSLLGTTYGGDGRVNFALPNLQGRVPIHMGNGFTLGQRGGEEAHTLTTSETGHSHPATQANATAASSTAQASPASGYWGNPGLSNYATTFDISMSPNCVATAGGSQPHENRSPFLVITFLIALQGIFPTQN